MVARTRSNKLAFEHGRFRLKIKRNILVVRMVKHWNILGWQTAFLKVHKNKLEPQDHLPSG